MGKPILLRAEALVLNRAWMRRGIHEHVHDEIIIVERGSYKAVSEGTEIDLSAGDAVWYPHGNVHEPNLAAFDGDSGLVHYVAFHSATQGKSQAKCVRDRRGRIRMLAMWLAELYVASGERDLIDAVLFSLVNEFDRLYGPDVRGDRMAELPAFIEEHLRHPVSVDEMAQFVGMGRRQFERSFRKRFATSPKAWLRQRRLELAIQLLQTTNLRLVDIAEQVGLSSAAQLNRLVATTGRKVRAWRET